METIKVDEATLNAKIKEMLLKDKSILKKVVEEILIKDKSILKEVINEIFEETPRETKEERLKRMEKLIDKDFDKYDEVFKALA